MGEITYPFSNFNGCTVEVWEWKSNFVLDFYNGCNYFSVLGLNLNHVSKRGHRGVKTSKTTRHRYINPTDKVCCIFSGLIDICWVGVQDGNMTYSGDNAVFVGNDMVARARYDDEFIGGRINSYRRDFMSSLDGVSIEGIYSYEVRIVTMLNLDLIVRKMQLWLPRKLITTTRIIVDFGARSRHLWQR